MKLVRLFLVFVLVAFASANAAPINVETGDLAGRKFAPKGLYAVWTGLSGTIPARAQVDFHRLLKQAWEAKCNRNHCTDVARDAVRLAPARYPEKPTRISLKEYLHSVDQEVNRVYQDTNWDQAGIEYRLSRQERETLKVLMRSVRAQELVAYSLTELMPDPHDGHLNVSVLRFLLRYAGREYVELLPAVNDKYTSFGPYQFTSFAIFNNGKEVRGASRANQVLKRGGIPGSVFYLKGPEHHRAAWLFAFDNLAAIVRDSTSQELVALRHLTERPIELAATIACAHHAPSLCRRAVASWIQEGARGEFSPRGRVAGYIKKTRTNYRSLG